MRFINNLPTSGTPFIVLAILLCCSFGPGSLTAEEDESAAEWQTVRHSAYIMFIPAGWEIETDQDESVVTAISPLTDSEDPFQENLLVNIATIKSGESLSQFTDQLCLSLEKSEDGFTLLDRGPAQFGNHSGLQVEATYDSTGETRHLQIFLIQEEDRIYTFIIRGENADLGGLAPLFEQIIATLYPFPKILGNVYFHEYFLIHLPESWDVKEGLPGTHVAGISPSTSSKDPFRERVTVGSQSLTDESQFEKSVESTFKNLLKQLPRARERDRTTYRIAGLDAPTLELSHRGYGDETILRVTMFPFNGRVYVLICSGRNPDFKRMLPVFNEILNSFASVSPPSKHPPNP